MASIDPIRLSKALNHLLRSGPEQGHLAIDPDGWATTADLAQSAERYLHAPVTPEEVVAAAAGGNVKRFEIEAERLRLIPRASDRPGPNQVPDILYHATTSERAERVRRQGALTLGRKSFVFLSTSEAEAWRVAHRLEGGRPEVLYVDAGRAQRRGVRFQPRRRGSLFVTRSVPARHILNLQDRFAEQLSAGGLPAVRDQSGQIRVALIQVTRRSGVTWEVAKGKLEPGEVPEYTAVREVQEEMGLSCDLRVTAPIGVIRYGFLAPGGLPRLKTVYLYLMEPLGPMVDFTPAEGEGIGAVRWFPLDEAVRAVTHTSLVPLMYDARDLLLRRPPALAPPA